MSVHLHVVMASAFVFASCVVHGFADLETLAVARASSLFLTTKAHSRERKSIFDRLFSATSHAFARKQVLGYRDAFTRWADAHTLWQRQCARTLA